MVALVSVLVFTNLLLHVASLPQNSSQPITDAHQAKALNSIFRQWNISAAGNASIFRTGDVVLKEGWNISGNLCTGTAVDKRNIENSTYSPLIKCDCSGSTCQITHLKVSGLNVAGVLPPELWMLTSLTYLNLEKNLLSGTLSPSVGNLTQLHTLSIKINKLSGKLPKELGQLANLRFLAFGTNNFSGTLPSELGNLFGLEELYFDSSGVQGDIPTTFSNLTNLRTVWASDNDLTGEIPGFIGSWLKLTTLRFQGNSFTGPIPSTFSNLTAMNELRIGDIPNGGSSLEFIRNMTSLHTLVLRNNKISDSIHSNIREFGELRLLDLSFNKFKGEIPEWLFKLNKLSYLSLGNNKLTGRLPSEKSDSLLFIDLSYNGLSGIFPGWVDDSTLQLNLIANSFTSGSVKSSHLHSGLNCLQREFSCNEDSDLRELKLAFPNLSTWSSLGRRIFDIYIQGNLVHKDFSIQNEAGGSFRAISKPFKAQVSKNYMEIHLFWAGKGTCCIPEEGTFGPSISAIIASLDSEPVSNEKNGTSQIKGTSSKKNGASLIVGIVVGVGSVCFLIVIISILFHRRKGRSSEDEGN
ncbi:probable LRR receptor-like serine/threonine-protein kinase At1g56130 isoform X4 [Benincasa hispida]|uniref:probable LRR receptor-like serine/threonine-protein kinase At1g56130 isoform X4 n=1 Tax=Benincasa hispida TaxID=102211 RepID=UPI0019022220|nr:probable LRR receptor-like serine/threonine-protein kinase At1g56130 isoform X4 [Benincasa hispida]